MEKKPDRTASCKKCGNTEFKIISKPSEIGYVCATCGNLVAMINCDRYETKKSICTNCESEIFKVRIKEDENTSYWVAYCNNCGNTPESIYLDSFGNIIDRKTKEILIMRDTIDDIQKKVSLFERDLKESDSKTNSIVMNLYSLEYDMDKVKKGISALENSLSNFDHRIKQIE